MPNLSKFHNGISEMLHSQGWDVRKYRPSAEQADNSKHNASDGYRKCEGIKTPVSCEIQIDLPGGDRLNHCVN